jgi:hypothetical protein
MILEKIVRVGSVIVKKKIIGQEMQKMSLRAMQIINQSLRPTFSRLMNKSFLKWKELIMSSNRTLEKEQGIELNL